jgi:nucleolar protein 4
MLTKGSREVTALSCPASRLAKTQNFWSTKKVPGSPVQTQTTCNFHIAMAGSRKRRRLSADGTFESAGNGEISHDNSNAQELPQKKSHRSTLFVRSLPASVTTKSLTEHFSQSYPLKHATVVLDPQTKQSRGYGFVTFVDPDDAQQAATELNGTLLEGRKIKVEIAEPRHRDVQEVAGGTSVKSVPSAEAKRLKADRESMKPQPAQPPKLIVRNLPWSIKDSEQLALLFRSYGKVKHATIPKKTNGSLSGFGFIVMRGRKNAERAIEGVNGKEIDGRTLAVDWAVEKSVWEEFQKSETKEAPSATYDEGNSDDEEVGQDAANKDEELNDVDDSPAEEDESDSESGSDVWIAPSVASIDEDEDINIEVDSQDGKDAESSKTADNDDSTLFIRNVPFTATDESLHEQFSQFGPLRYARIVVDRESERPRGTGFVCFRRREDAISCIREAPKTRLPKKTDEQAIKHSILEQEGLDLSGRYTLDGRVLQVSRAVSRNEANRLESENSTHRIARDRDKRRLFLLLEGTIPRDSSLYAKLSASEINMREASAKQRQSFIKNNPSLHISLTRLSVRNIPRNIASKDLKALAREAVVGFAKDVKAGRRQPLSKEELHRSNVASKEAEHERKLRGKGIVKQAKIVFEGKEGGKVSEKSGAGRSRGYGFIEYVSHRSALMGLRWLNGHAVGGKDGSGKSLSKEDAQERKKRLIVEFAIENAVVVGRRQERETRAKEHPRKLNKDGVMTDANTTEIGDRGTPKDRKKGGKKRKRDKSDSGAGAPPKVAKPSILKQRKSDEKKETADTNKLAKRNRIIAKKRMARKARKAG